MKKLIAFIGALFLGSASFAQVSKTDSINKKLSRKVLTSDVDKLPVEADGNANDSYIKGSVHQKIRGGQSRSKSDEIKETMTEKSSAKVITTEKQHYTIKMSNRVNKAKIDSTTENDKTSDYHLKIPSQKKE